VARILLKSAWGSGDPTQASFPFLHGAGFADLGHEVQIFLLAEAVTLMRDEVVDGIVPLGWPPLREAFDRVVAHRIPIHV
jgi:predicted peroxiredoxin